MKRWIGLVVPAVTAGLLWGCAGSDADDPIARSVAGSGGAEEPTGGRDDGSDTGGATMLLDGGAPCPSTCDALQANCGTVTDDVCGGVIECGECAGGEICGAVAPNQCGRGEAPPCQAMTCEALGADCGAIGDGCGVLLDCGTCPVDQLCGAVTANRCDVGTSCAPLTCAELMDVECGLQGDGCGDTIDCGDCPTGEECVTRDGRSQCIVRV